MADEIHLNDIKTRFKITLKDDDTVVDISTASVKSIIFRKPNGTYVTKTASFLTDGTDGVIYYDSQSGDLDQVGTWRIQAYVETSSGGKWYSETSIFRVNRNLSY